MAEKKFLKGLFKDTGHIDQPEGTWRHARNMVLNEKMGSISNEGGTEMSGYLGTTISFTGAQDDKVVGAIEVSNNRVVLFLVNVINSIGTTGQSPRSEIGMWEKGKYYPIFNPDISLHADLRTNLGFSINHPIEGTFKIDSKGDLIVYFTDDLNPPRAFNIDRQLRDSGDGTLAGVTITNLYGITSANIQHIDILNLFPYSGTVPHIYAQDVWWGSATPPNHPYQGAVVEGGGLLTGVYYLTLAYVDDDLVATNYLTVSNPISIVDEYDHTNPTTKKDGAKAGSQTSKGITWRVNNLNDNYKYLRPVIIRKMGDATEAFRLNDIAITLNLATPPFQEINFSGREGFTPAAVEEVIIDTISYDTAKTIQQLDNVLYLGNTTKSVDLGYQKYANNIKSRSIIKEMDPFDRIFATADFLQTGFGQSPVNSNANNLDGVKLPPDGSYRYIPNILNYRGYMRDEVYAFYIAFIMKDGSMSYAYHIPGREYMDGLSYTEHDIAGNASSEVDKVPPTTKAANALKRLSEDAKTFHFYDQSWVNSGANSWSGGSRYMQYWENASEVYPNTSNFEVWNGNAGHTGAANDLKDEKVRHHKMPSNANKKRTTVTDDLDIVITPSETDPTPPVPGYYSGNFRVRVNPTEGDYSAPTGFSNGAIKGSNFLCGGGNTGAPCFTATPPCNIKPNLNSTFNDNATSGTPCAAVYNTGGNGNYIADTMSSVTVDVHMQYCVDDDNWSSVYGRLVHTEAITGNRNTPQIGNIKVSAKFPAGGPLQAFLEFPDACSGSCNGDWTGTLVGSATIQCQSGDTIEYESHGQAGSPSCSDRYATALKHNVSQGFGVHGTRTTNSWVQYTVTQGGHEDYHDADIKHKVNVLGLHFDDIKIPASYKEKIQGFRIYRAKRDHSNKTVLGQSHIIPMKPLTGVLGLCQEAYTSATNSEFAAQVLGTEGREPENFYSATAWKETAGNYPGTSGPSDQYNLNEQGYKNLQFYDFNLLRDKQTLAPATHIQVQYRTADLVWNGPEINQPKKMLTYLSQTGTSPIDIQEIWGWDAFGPSATFGVQNCYTKTVNSAMFVGAKYERAFEHFATMSTWGINRVLGQKAKSYLQGDSIFNATSLGFGGKVVNLGGNSSIILSLASKLELPAQNSHNGSGGAALDVWGIWQSGMGFNLVTRTDNEILGTSPSDPPRHQNYIVNLNSFKTDVYKSIDTQELVFTGFEIFGEDLNNFIFDDGSFWGTLPLMGMSTAPNFSTDSTNIGNVTNNGPNGASMSGVFGGDTFIARYGVAEAYAPQDNQTPSVPSTSIHSYIVESPDNIAFRHSESDDSLYYPGSVAKDVLSVSGRNSDLNHIDNIKYNPNYSAVNDIRPAFPLPVRDTLQSDFPTRTHRSAKHDTTSIIDNYRVFLANQFKDLPKNRGDLWSLASFNNLLYFHMEESLFAAKGKQSMQMKDGSEAFVGSGDIFQQDPDEIIQTKGGYGGTQSQWASLTSRYGYFFVDQDARKIFLMADKLSEISTLGMEEWFRNNLPFELEDKYNFTSKCSLDNPIVGMGFHSIYDPQFKRIILTKREFIPKQTFIDGWEADTVSGPCTSYPNGKIRFNSTKCIYQQYGVLKNGSCGWTDLNFSCTEATSKFECKGWTISYYPELNIWGSFHDYIPYIYFNTSTDFYSLTDKYPIPSWVVSTNISLHLGTTYGNAGIWKHNSITNHGILYQENVANQYNNNDWLTSVNYYPFEFEFIHNETKIESSLLGAFNYTLETFNQDDISVLQHGFTSFFIYNTFQLSGIGQDWLDLNGSPQLDSSGNPLTAASISSLEYLINTRRIGNNWKINNFRDMAASSTNTSAYYMSTNINVIGGTNTGTITTSSTNNMFIYDGMHKIANASYLDLTKNWSLQRKFIDKWVGIRLIYDNITNNSLNLYSTNVVVRKAHR